MLGINAIYMNMGSLQYSREDILDVGTCCQNSSFNDFIGFWKIGICNTRTHMGSRGSEHNVPIEWAKKALQQ